MLLTVKYSTADDDEQAKSVPEEQRNAEPAHPNPNHKHKGKPALTDITQGTAKSTYRGQ